MKAKVALLTHEWKERGWINCQKYIIDLTSCGTYTFKWYLLFVNNNFVNKKVLKIINWTYILLGNNHLGNIFAEVIILLPLFASIKTLTIADCQGEFQGLKFKNLQIKDYIKNWESEYRTSYFSFFIDQSQQTTQHTIIKTTKDLQNI